MKKLIVIEIIVLAFLILATPALAESGDLVKVQQLLGFQSPSSLFAADN